MFSISVGLGFAGIISVFSLFFSFPVSFSFSLGFSDALSFTDGSSSSGLTGSNPNKTVGSGGSSPITPSLIADCVAVSSVLSIRSKVEGSFVPAGSRVYVPPSSRVIVLAFLVYLI